jgi:hypothetical protein
VNPSAKLARVSQTCREFQRLTKGPLFRALTEFARFSSLDEDQRRTADAPVLSRLTPSQHRVWFEAVVLRRSVWVTGGRDSGKTTLYLHLCDHPVPGLCVVDAEYDANFHILRSTCYTQMDENMPAYADRAWNFHRAESRPVRLPIDGSGPWWWLLSQ